MADYSFLCFSQQDQKTDICQLQPSKHRQQFHLTHRKQDQRRNDGFSREVLTLHRCKIIQVFVLEKLFAIFTLTLR